ncbi:MAG TPA: hypothetical protein VG722_12425 [Tepidisphaeraceae bacterium]|nr:hypothetical protein [Tepidisphaeraceae bacterium]
MNAHMFHFRKSLLTIFSLLAIVMPVKAQVSIPISADIGSAPTNFAITPKIDPAVKITPRQLTWLNATLDQRVRLAEDLGEEGAQAFASYKGAVPLLLPHQRTVPQGPDLIYEMPNGPIVAIEAKGGGSPLGYSYGFAQGTPENAIKSAERILQSPKTSDVERQAARRVLESARDGDFEVWTVRTRHVLGEPTAAVLEKTSQSTSESKILASQVLDRAAAPKAEAFALHTEEPVSAVAESALRPIGRSVPDIAEGASASAPSLAMRPSALKIMGGSGLLVFAVDSTELAFHCSQGKLTPLQVEQSCDENGVKAIAVALTTYGVIVLGANPVGLTVIIASGVAYVITDYAIAEVRPYYSTTPMTAKQIDQTLPLGWRRAEP